MAAQRAERGMSGRAALVLACLLTWCTEAAAMVGGAAPAPPQLAPHVVVIVGSRGNLFTRTPIARGLVLTAPPRLLSGAHHKLVGYHAPHPPLPKDVAHIPPHP